MTLEERKEAIEEYQKLAKLHSLPSCEELEEELDVRLDKSPSLPFFLRCVHERISNSLAHLEIVLHPSRMADMIETKFHSDEEKNDIFNFYKEAMGVLHEIILAVYTNKKEEIVCFKKTWVYYLKTVKPFMQSFLKKQIECWQKEAVEEKVEAKQRYVR